jgi:hypothetical protein
LGVEVGGAEMETEVEVGRYVIRKAEVGVT